MGADLESFFHYPGWGLLRTGRTGAKITADGG
jgi:hypothetical protein